MAILQILNIRNNNAPPKVLTTQSFRGATTSQIPQDTVDVSVKNKKNRNITTSFILGCLGIAGAIFAWVKFHKTTSIKAAADDLSGELKEVQQLYKDIFKRDINAEETRNFVKIYKTIIDSKTPDNDREYCEKLLDEICKDRKTKRPDILRWISNPADADPACVRGGMSTAPDGTYIDIYAYNYYKNPNLPAVKGFFESLFHETHHVKQIEMIYRTDKEFLLQHLFDKFVLNGEGKMYKEMLMKNGGNEENTLKEVRALLTDYVEGYWGGLEKYAKNSAEYKEGLCLIEGKKNYKFFGECTGDEYRNQVIEKGAYADGKKAVRLFDILKTLTI